MSGTCHACSAQLDDLLVWEDSEKNRFCSSHSSLGIPIFHVLGGCVPVARLNASITGELSSAREEVVSARKEMEAFRDKVNTAAAHSDVPQTDRPVGSMMLGTGDRTELVTVRSAETGSRTEQQLVGVLGALRLTDKSRENGAPLWSVPKGQLVRAVGTVASTAGLPFLLLLEGPHSEVQVWCRSVESLDAWLRWIPTHHPEAKVSRVPPFEAVAGSAIKRPVPSKLSASFWHGANGAGPSSAAPTAGSKSASSSQPLTLRQRFQRVASRHSVEDSSQSGDDASPASSVSSPSTPNVTPQLTRLSLGEQQPPPPVVVLPVSARRDGSGSGGGSGTASGGGSGFGSDDSGSDKPGRGKKMFGWAKKLYDKAGDAVQRNNASNNSSSGGGGGAKMLDVFATSLEDLMAEQAETNPTLQVPILMRFLAEEIVRLGGHRTEGIFRISASHADVAEAVATIRKAKGFEYRLAAVNDAHIPAAVMKQWLRALPVPVFQDYFRCIEVSKLPSNSAEEREAYCDMVQSLSEVHRNVVLFLIGFLTTVGDPVNVAVTKMPLANLALVFVPSFLRCPNDDISVMLTNQPAEQKFVQTLVELGAEGVFGALPAEVAAVAAPAKERKTSSELPDPQP